MKPLERLFTDNYASLLAFFGRRIRNRSDAADLAQEVYVRLLRVSDPDSIRDPQAYLFAVASNLAKEQSLLDRQRAMSIDVAAPMAEAQLAELPTFERDYDRQQRIERLRVVLNQLPVKCRTVVMLQYHHGFNHQEVAKQVGISTHMVKKYLAQALAHCRRRMQGMA